MAKITTSKSKFPAVPNCTNCDNQLVGRSDGMVAIRVIEVRNNGSHKTRAWLCEPCAEAQYGPAATK